MKKLLAKLGKLGKGAATIIGGVATAAGITLGGGDDLARCASELASHPESAVAAAGTLLTLFGLARKAGWLGATTER